MAYISSDYGAIGDYYIDVDTGDFYGPKTIDGWPDTPFFTAVTTVTQQNERYVHIQSTPSTVWTINHSLGGHPSVTIVDSSDTMVIGEVTYVSDTQISVSFSAAFSGYAYLT